MVGAMKRRLDALESKGSGGFKPYVQVIQHVDQSEDEAIAAYEAEHGALEEDPNVLLVIIRKPELICE